MSLEHVLGLTKQIEGKLQALGATGRGLHEKATSIEAVLGTELTKRIRFLATVRNKLVHDPEVVVSGSLLVEFSSAAADVISRLDGLLHRHTAPPEAPPRQTSGADVAAAWRETPTRGKVAIVAGALAAGALWIKWKMHNW